MSEGPKERRWFDFSWLDLLTRSAIAIAMLLCLLAVDVYLNLSYGPIFLRGEPIPIFSWISAELVGSVGIAVVIGRYAQRFLRDPIASNRTWASLWAGFAIYVALLLVGVVVRLFQEF